MALQSDHEFAPTEIARAVFPTAFRGYDQDAVRRYLSRLAAALEHQQTFEDLGDLEVRVHDDGRVEELETELASLQDEIRELETELVQRSVDQADEGSRRSSEVVEFDEARAIELLGQETARVLESARSAASDILKRAENQATGLKSEAKRELAEARRQAKELMADKQAEVQAAIDELTEEAERSANRITDEAESHRADVVEESSKILADAGASAKAEQDGARGRAGQIVADAEALRHQVVAELVADRRRVKADLAEMLNARDRLARSLGDARTELDQLADQLTGITEEAGDAGEPEDGSDDDEVADLIGRLERQSTASSTGPDRATVEREEHDDLDEAGEGRRSTVDEPTQEMPAISSAGAEADADRDIAGGLDGAGDARERVEADAGGPHARGDATVGQESRAARSYGVFDRDDDLIDLRDVDLDLAGSDEVLNAPPAEGVPLSLVEGFSTIVLNDDDEAPSARSKSTGSGNGNRNGNGRGHAQTEIDATAVGTLIDDQVDPASVITTVAARSGGRSPSRSRGDLVIDEPFTERLPDHFGARDVAVTRSEANLRRQLRRALNDDQSEVLDRLRSGRGPIASDELRPEAEQIERFLAPLRRGLTDVARAGARAGGVDEVEPASLDNLVGQLAAYVVDRVRAPTVEAIEAADHDDREKILEPIRSIYRDFRNIGLPELATDALNEGFAIGLHDSIVAGSPVAWVIDPRTDPDPVCEVNRDRQDLVKSEPFPSGHVRPLALPGCRCLVVAVS